MISKNGQNIFDLVLQTTGGVEGLKEFLQNNPGATMEVPLIPTTFVFDAESADIKTKQFFASFTPVAGEVVNGLLDNGLLVDDLYFLEDGDGNIISYE